jgi:hypothetical protein
LAAEEKIYRTVVLLSHRALLRFYRHLDEVPLAASYVQHLWIGSRDLHSKAFFNVLSIETGNAVAAAHDIDALLLRLPKLMSLALGASLAVDRSLKKFPFELVEIISSEQDGKFKWGHVPSAKMVRRAYLASRLTSRRSAAVGSDLPFLESLEIVWCREPCTAILREMLDASLSLPAPPKVCVRSDKVILEVMRPNLVPQRQNCLQDLVPPAKAIDVGFMMDEWEGRISRTSYWPSPP